MKRKSPGCAATRTACAGSGSLSRSCSHCAARLAASRRFSPPCRAAPRTGKASPVPWSASFRRSKNWNARLPSVQIPAATSSQSSIKSPMPAIRKFCAEDTCLASALNRSQWRCTWNIGGSGGGISRQSKCCFFSRFEHFGAFLSRFKQISALFQAFWDHNPFTFRGHSVIII
nr:MAG TPA: hypothetical protein [Caudoviricetes sp.]